MSDLARRQLDELAATYGRPEGPGHWISAHRHLGYCALCVRLVEPRAAAHVWAGTEVTGWRLDAIIRDGQA